MPIRVRTARLRSRLDRLAHDLPSAAGISTIDLAHSVIRVVQEQARNDWTGSDNQVGFDVDQWNTLIEQVETTGQGGFGILNVNRMGTAEDFEAISQAPRSASRDEQLWHVGQRMGDSFRRLIQERPANRTMLAQARQAIWGDKQPQWWFMNYGNVGFTGAYPVHAGTYTIEFAAMGYGTADIDNIISNSVNEYLRSRGTML